MIAGCVPETTDCVVSGTQAVINRLAMRGIRLPGPEGSGLGFRTAGGLDCPKRCPKGIGNPDAIPDAAKMAGFRCAGCQSHGCGAPLIARDEWDTTSPSPACCAPGAVALAGRSSRRGPPRPVAILISISFPHMSCLPATVRGADSVIMWITTSAGHRTSIGVATVVSSMSEVRTVTASCQVPALGIWTAWAA